MQANGNHSPTALRRWSCQDKQLPAVHDIKSIHIYDFDNTLFASPLPNKSLWAQHTCGHLQGQEFLHEGGWWHNPKILGAVGQGIEVEEPRAWEGCWNETVAELSRLSMQDPMTLTVLLTGRSETGFADLVGRMVASKGLSYDIMALKPTAGPNGQSFGSTMLFKQELLRDIVYTYSAAEEIKVYEDRPKHTKAFRDFFAEVNRDLHMYSGPLPTPREPIHAEVIQVAEQEALMDPVAEVAEVQRMINVNNQAILDGTASPRATPYKIKRSVFYTGYNIQQQDIDKLKSLVQVPSTWSEHEFRFLANNILITPRPAAASILDKVGGIGAKMKWRVTGIANFENRIWAARVTPAIPGTSWYSENKTPCVVLATKRNVKPFEASYIKDWQTVGQNKALEFETTVGERVLLRIEEEFLHEDEYEASFPNGRNARKHPRDEDFPPLGTQRPAANKALKPQQRGNHSGAWQNKPAGAGYGAGRGGGGARGGGRGGGQTGNFRGRGRGGGGGGAGGGRGGAGGRGRGGYRSLDDNMGQGYGGGSMQY